MIKPNNYDNVTTGDFTPVEPGGHHMIIKQVKEMNSKAGKPMLVIAVDFAPTDKQPKYFSKLFEEDIRPDKKWPHAGTIYVVSVDANGQCSRNFKTFITSFEKSNGVQVSWDDGPAFTAQFAGKKIGGVYGRVEEEYNGERRIRCLHRWFCEDGKADGAKAPADKLLSAGAVPTPAGFTAVETEEVPF